MAEQRTHKVNRSLGGNIASFAFLLVLAGFMALPLAYVISTAFKPIDELFLYPPRFFVRNPTLDNFASLLVLMGESWVPFTRYVFNTLFVTTAGTVGHVVLASMAAFALAKHEFRGRNLMFSTIVLTLMFSGAVTQVPSYLILSRLNLIDTPLSTIIPAIQASLGLYLMRQFMTTVPDSLLESARIDGAREFRVFWSIAMPAVKPAWLTLVILTVQALWNNTSPYIYKEQLKSLPQALSQILAGGIARAGTGSAVAFLMLLVPLGAFILTQTQVIETMTTSGIKE